ncbi:alpha/beta hydrolase [Corynebacterium alimapuense]|uniref:Esterase family protein n=1 Tax=Corynebacterium alimapuense TaxID=1576874 RepID=A0A3M8K8X5_9CORY|nr:alpha/beta hydrolase family protein [Corynebacterium alimapuense]RNE49620.1 esterase family protein [Corynebacterium alimapuense]
MHKQSRTFFSVIAAAALAVGAASPAAAQSSTDEAFETLQGSIAFGEGSVVSSSQSIASSGSSLDATLSSLSLLGSSEIPLGGGLTSSDSDYPLATRQIDTAEIVDKSVIDAEQRLERWTVASPNMQRDVSVQIMKSADSTANSPMLYLFDGISAPYNSGWFREGDANSVFAEENVTLVLPNEAPGSLYSDWVSEDPALGVNMWETFIVEELAPLLEAESELNFNGKRGVGGLSMGAIGAVNLANSNPDMFDATFGISGCYSTLDPIGRQMVNLVTGSRGGDVENMWGTFGSQEWIDHDVVSHPEGLADMAVYLSAADGAITETNRAHYAGDVISMTAGSVLERGVLSCTEDLDAAMTDLGMTHHVVHYKGPGVHNWPNYQEELPLAWTSVKSSLY